MTFLGVDERRVQVKYGDYGNFELLSLDRLFLLPESVLDTPLQVMLLL